MATKPKKEKQTQKEAALALVVMGSDSDMPVAKPAIDTLAAFGVVHEVEVASAHRAPKYLASILEKFEKQGGKVVIAAAGRAAHLPGVVASMTCLPVIGLPVGSPFMDGLDSLLSIVQMPSGMPVATVAVDGGKNAALLSIQMLAISNADLAAKYAAFRQKQTQDVIAKSKSLKKERQNKK